MERKTLTIGRNMSLIVDHLLADKFSQDTIDEILNTENKSLYKIFTIKQKGKERVIEEPIQLLKEIQQSLISFFSIVDLHPSCMAKKGKSILNNAELHMDATNILKVDIKKCYPSITLQHLISSFMLKHIELLEDIDKIAKFCFLEKDSQLVLPTGAPTSPILCNIALHPIDLQIQTLADQYNYIYSRYIDDMIFSNTIVERHWDLKEKVEQILQEHLLVPNFKKSKWARRTDKMIVTGVRINGSNRVPKDFSRLLRAKLQNLAKENKEIDQETRGCLAYVQSIDPQKYEDFLKYFERRKAYVPSQ